MNIWANNITNLTDARYFAAYNADWVCFCFDKNSPHSIAPNVAAGIAGWLEGPKIAGSFAVTDDSDFIKNIAENLNLQAIVLNKNHNISELNHLPIFFELNIDDAKNQNFQEFLENNKQAKGFIFNFKEEKNNNIFSSQNIDFDILEKATKRFPIYLNLDLSIEKVEEVLNKLPALQGIILQGGEEEAVGVKSFEDLDDIIDILTAND